MSEIRVIIIQCNQSNDDFGNILFGLIEKRVFVVYNIWWPQKLFAIQKGVK